MIRRRGFTLVELLLAIVLLGVFGVLAMHLIRANFQVARSILSASDDSARFDGAVTVLRADLAASISTEMPETGLLRIHLPDNHSIDWQTQSAALSRKQGNDVHTWPIGQSVNLKMDGAILLLSSQNDAANPLALATKKVSVAGGKQ